MKYKANWFLSLFISGMLIIGCSSASMASSSPSFTDVPKGHWAESAIMNAAHQGIINGVPGGLFKPNANVSRVEFLKMALLAAGIQVPDRDMNGTWYAPFVKAATDKGIYKSSDFKGWTDPSTRLEMARMALRALDPSLKNASDKQLMYEATKRGLINGVANGQLGKDEKSTRAQAAVIIDRMLSVKNGATLTPDKRAASYAEVEYRGSNLETMWGGHMYALPLKLDLSYAVRGTFEQILIIDLDDPNSPYHTWVPEKGISRYDKKSLNGNYLVAFRVLMENFNIAPKTTVFFDRLVGNPYFMGTVVLEGYDDKTPLDRKPIQLDKKNTVRTWQLVTISKTDLAKYQNLNDMFWYFEWSSGKRINLSKEGRIFGE